MNVANRGGIRSEWQDLGFSDSGGALRLVLTSGVLISSRRGPYDRRGNGGISYSIYVLKLQAITNYMIITKDDRKVLQARPTVLLEADQ